MTKEEAVALIGRHGILRQFAPPRLEEGLFVCVGFLVDPGDLDRACTLFVSPVDYGANAGREGYECRSVRPELFGPTPTAAVAFRYPGRN